MRMWPRRFSDALARFAARRIHRALGSPNARFALRDGSALGPSADAATATLHFADARAPLELAFDPQLAFGDLYVAGRIRVEGSLVDLICLSNACPSDVGFGSRLGRRARVPAAWRQSLGRAARNARRHYDAGNDF